MRYSRNCFNNDALVALAWVLLLIITGGMKETSAQEVSNTAALYVSSGTTLFVGGNFTNKAGATTEDQGTLELDGNWINNGTFTAGTGSVVFSGSSPQSITKPGLESYYRLTINNTSTGVTLNDDVEVTNSLTLTDGVVTTSSTNLLTLTNGATSTSGSAASFVDGPIRKIGSQAFVFPLGDNIIWSRLGISAPTLANTAYTAQYFDAGYTDLSVIAPLVNVSNIEYWTLDQAINNDDVQVTLHWEDSIRSKINNCVSTDLGVARYNGTDWVDEGQSAIACGVQGDVSSNVVANYSPFTLRSKSTAQNPLPIELLYFNAVLLNNQMVSVEWTTVVELNNDFFTVERSSNGVDFEIVATIPGAGNSNVELNYSFLDDEPLKGVSYYRLEQTDYDGSYTYSPIAVINREDISLVTMYPIPAVGSLTLLVHSSLETNMRVEIIDIIGRKVLKSEIALQEGGNEFFLDISDITSGMYLLNLTTKSGQYNIQKEFVVTTYR